MLSLIIAISISSQEYVESNVTAACQRWQSAGDVEAIEIANHINSTKKKYNGKIKTLIGKANLNIHSNSLIMDGPTAKVSLGAYNGIIYASASNSGFIGSWLWNQVKRLNINKFEDDRCFEFKFRSLIVDDDLITYNLFSNDSCDIRLKGRLESIREVECPAGILSYQISYVRK